MSNSKNANGKIVFRYEGISYLCETNQHDLCGGDPCNCSCHIDDHHPETEPDFRG